MGIKSKVKWEKSLECRPVHNIISSDFPKYNPQPWKFMVSSKRFKKLEGKSRIEWLLSYEYQRMWINEREAWRLRMYPEKTTHSKDVVKDYVLSFKNMEKPRVKETKKPFKMKKFEKIESKTTSKRAPDDKAMSYEKKTLNTIKP